MYVLYLSRVLVLYLDGEKNAWLMRERLNSKPSHIGVRVTENLYLVKKKKKKKKNASIMIWVDFNYLYTVS